MEIYCINNKKTESFNPGVTFTQIFNTLKITLRGCPMCVYANGKVMDMEAKVYEDCDVEFLDATTSTGARSCLLGLVFVLYKAITELYPGGRIRVSNAISKGFYCPVEIGRDLTDEDVTMISERMGSIIGRSIPFVRHTAHTKEVADIMEKSGRKDSARLLRSIGTIYSSYYTLEELPDWFFGVLPPHTGCLKVFGLEPMSGGVLVRLPDKHNPDQLEPMIRQDKMFGIFKEHHDWMRILGFSTLGKLNEAIAKGQTNMIINVAEALQSQKIVHIADQIVKRRNEGKGLKLIMVSGPSSSGKTTFSKRLMVQLLAHGLTPKVLSLDDYFLDRDHTPLDENGEHDFESLYAIDLPFFNEQLKDLLSGKSIRPPRFNFKKGGIREFTEPEMSLGENDVLLIEGIHALNPDLMPDIPAERRFLIYVSALTSIRIDQHNYIPTTDNRLLRRITRDHKYRSYSAQDTIGRWASVRAGEEKWIFPYQENADAMFNSAMIFEIAVIKDMVAPILEEVPEDSPQYAKACQLKDFLKLFRTIPSQNLPPTSLVREFIGGSSFHY
ncbi:MAG: nucleoside kinase [Bacteroidaceae bacterium]|nr:nucleoside kinase [Bacteroidaceae bacterium]MBP5347315.1 nucleoside kinase [Bacteroidaceae bacterium]